MVDTSLDKQHNISISPSSSYGKGEDIFKMLNEYEAIIAKRDHKYLVQVQEMASLVAGFLNTPVMLDSERIDQICQTLENSEKQAQDDDADFNAYPDKLTPTFSSTVYQGKAEFIKNQKDTIGYYKILSKYISPDSKCMDIFCGKGSSIESSVKLFALFGVNRLLAVDLFNQKNEIKENIHDENYGWFIAFKEGESTNILPGNKIAIDHFHGNEYVFPEMSTTSIQADAYDTLKIMPDDSIDALMMNNVDHYIIQKDGYVDKLRSEAKRVVKNKGLIFGYGSSAWPHMQNYIENEIGGLVAFENNK